MYADGEIVEAPTVLAAMEIIGPQHRTIDRPVLSVEGKYGVFSFGSYPSREKGE